MGDVFVSASVSETQGLTFIEAMTADTPVVAIHSPYLDTIVTDENIGTLVDDSFGLLEPMVMYLKAKTTGETIGNPDTGKLCMRLTNEHLVNASLISMQKRWLFIMKRRIRKLLKQTMWSTQKHSCFGIHSDEMINDYELRCFLQLKRYLVKVLGQHIVS